MKHGRKINLSAFFDGCDVLTGNAINLIRNVNLVPQTIAIEKRYFDKKVLMKLLY